MNPAVTISRDADADIFEIYSYFAEIESKLADRFMDSLELSCELLLSQTHMGSPRFFLDAELLGVRMWRVRGFESYLIFYKPLADGIELVRILHEKRDYLRLLE